MKIRSFFLFNSCLFKKEKHPVIDNFKVKMSQNFNFTFFLSILTYTWLSLPLSTLFMLKFHIYKGEVIMSSLIPFPSRRNKDPFALLKRDFSRLLEDLSPGREISSFFNDQIDLIRPDIDVSETENEVIIHAELPGIEEKNISVELNNNILTLRGEKKIDRTQEGRDFHIVERQSGSFTRSIQLPFEIDQDHVSANFSKGVLTVTLPKSQQAQQKVKKIEIHKKENGS
jgi:HSP20 family protein